MTRIRFPRGIGFALALAAAGASCPAFAQNEIVSAPNPDADRLAEQIRVIAADPRDVAALIRAGVLSARLNDTAAALAFFARAEEIDSRNPRILAGRGMALVRLERPGEALRLFQSAEAQGLPVREYAADRGLAYDLLGQPLLAQQDYRLALQGERDDETVRRYALSLGITGQEDAAMRELDPLLRRSDRAGWRARAFILAMNGDIPAAERIASSMMPGNMGLALTPFLHRLGDMSAADRAHAVHFGSLTPTPARLADARLAPPMPRTPVQMAAAEPPRGPETVRRARDARTNVPSRSARNEPAPGSLLPARSRSRSAEAAPVVRTRTAEATPTPTPTPVPTPAPAATPKPPPATRPPVQLASRVLPVPERAAPAAAPPVSPSVSPSVVPEAHVPAPTSTLPFSARPDSAAAGGPAPAPAPAPERAPEAAPVLAAQPEPTPPGPARVGQEDSVLAAIVGNITIPGEELEAVTARPTASVPVASVTEAEPSPAPAARAAEAPAEKPAAAKPVQEKKPEAAKKPEAKPKPKAKAPTKPAEPARVWVQVAGGANENTLPRAWAAVAAKAPALFKGKSGWWTPLRATNRVLAGPFKSADEAQDFVNALAKEDVSGFVFKSEDGQKVTKLAAK